MLRVWADGKPVGLLDRHGPRGATFVYDRGVEAWNAVSLTMPVRSASWNFDFGLLPIFDMNLPEGALRSEIQLRFGKATGSFDDFDLLSVVGRSQIGRLRLTPPDVVLDESVPFTSIDEILSSRRGSELYDYLLDRYAAVSGISGVQPKVLARTGKAKANDDEFKLTVKSATHIVKVWRPGEYPELAANEWFCLEQDWKYRVMNYHSMAAPSLSSASIAKTTGATVALKTSACSTRCRLATNTTADTKPEYSVEQPSSSAPMCAPNGRHSKDYCGSLFSIVP
jgi:HipA-like protein